MIVEDIEIPVEYGRINLVGSICYKRDTPKASSWVIILSGFMEHRKGKFVHNFIERFVKANYYVLAYDHRAHGDTIKYTGRNWLKMIEKIYSDLPKVIDWLFETQKERILNNKVALFGRSFGGAIILTRGFKEKMIKKLIALCTRYDYASFRAGSMSFSEDNIKTMSPKYFLEKDSSNNDRILIAHCKDDERIPFHNLQLIKEKLDLSDENVIAFETGGHSFRGNRENIFNEAIRFLNRE
jgi:esterase/lipase